MILPANLFRGRFLVLDSIHVRDYHFFVMGSINYEPKEKDLLVARKSKSLQNIGWERALRGKGKRNFFVILLDKI